MIRCLTKNTFKIHNYSIEPYRREDILKIKQWRNEQMVVLRQNKILTETDQINYYENSVLKSFEEENPKIILFSFLQESQCIGYGGLTNIDWTSKRAEISFLVETLRADDKELYKKDFTVFLQLMKIVTYETLNFNRLFTETFDIRDFHISIIESVGFKQEGRMKQHVWVDGKFADSLLHGHLKEYYELER